MNLDKGTDPDFFSHSITGFFNIFVGNKTRILTKKTLFMAFEGMLLICAS